MSNSWLACAVVRCQFLDWWTARFIRKIHSVWLRLSQWNGGSEQNHTFYFAYGANINSDRLMRLDSCAEVLGIACLSGYRLRFSVPTECVGHGFATIAPAHGENVWGVLYKLSVHGMKRLDVLEYVPFGVYCHQSVSVFSNGRIYHNVIAYKTHYEEDNLAPSMAYLHSIIRSSKLARLPDDYIASLTEISPTTQNVPNCRYSYFNIRRQARRNQDASASNGRK